MPQCPLASISPTLLTSPKYIPSPVPSRLIYRPNLTLVYYGVGGTLPVSSCRPPGPGRFCRLYYRYYQLALISCMHGPFCLASLPPRAHLNVMHALILIYIVYASGSGVAAAGSSKFFNLSNACQQQSVWPVMISTGTTAAGSVAPSLDTGAAFGSPEYCCSGEGEYGAACKPSAYSEFFKQACPRASSSYANDVVTFCPPTMKRYRS